MYRQYKALPEGNKICIKAARDRAYQQHLSALRNMKSSLDTKRPMIPQTLGRNYKRFENEKHRNAIIARDNNRLLRHIESFQHQENYPAAPIQRPFTLQGQAQRDEMSRITFENHKLLKAVQQRKPILNRNEWLKHRLDHEYQITKMSEFKKTVPMSQIIRKERNLFSRNQDTFQEEPSQYEEDKNTSKVDLEEETQTRTNALLGDTTQESKKQTTKENNKNNQGRLEEVNNSVATGLLGPSTNDNNEEIRNDENQEIQDEVIRNDNNEEIQNDENQEIQNEEIRNDNNEEIHNEEIEDDDNQEIQKEGIEEEENRNEETKNNEEGGVLEQETEQITGSLLS